MSGNTRSGGTAMSGTPASGTPASGTTAVVTGTDTGTMDPGDKSAAQIEREVEGTRARLAQNLEALRESVSPGNLMDQAVDYVRTSGGPEFAQSLGRAVRENPLPVALIGAGLGWLLLSGGRSSTSSASSSTSQTRPSSATVSYRTVTEGGVTRVIEAGRSDSSATSYSMTSSSTGGPSMTERAGAAASGMAERVGDAAGQAYQSAADAAGSVVQRVSDAASSVARGASDLGQDLRHQASRTGGQAQGGLDWLLREQPLVVGAVGVALGAALGALLPGTETEDRLMGEASDSLTRQVKDAAGEGYERVQQVAGEQIERAKDAAAGAYDSAKGQADQSGLSAGKVADAVGSAAHHVREAVREGAQTVAGQARDAINQADPASETAKT